MPRRASARTVLDGCRIVWRMGRLTLVLFACCASLPGWCAALTEDNTAFDNHGQGGKYAMERRKVSKVSSNDDEDASEHVVPHRNIANTAGTHGPAKSTTRGSLKKDGIASTFAYSTEEEKYHRRSAAGEESAKAGARATDDVVGASRLNKFAKNLFAAKPRVVSKTVPQAPAQDCGSFWWHKMLALVGSVRINQLRTWMVSIYNVAFLKAGEEPLRFAKDRAEPRQTFIEEEWFERYKISTARRRVLNGQKPSQINNDADALSDELDKFEGSSVLDWYLHSWAQDHKGGVNTHSSNARVRHLTAACMPFEQYQSGAVVLDCSAGSGNVSVELQNGLTTLIAEIPANVDGVSISLQADGDLDLQLYDGDRCVFGYGCTYSSAGTNTYSGVDITFSGDQTVAPVEESIVITGKTTTAFSLSVKAYATTTGTITFSYGPITPCPDVKPGCSLCSSFTQCPSGSNPACDGTSNVNCVAQLAPTPAPTPAPTAPTPAPTAPVANTDGSITIVTSVSEAVSQGGVQVALADITGINIGDTITLSSSGVSETKIVIAVTASSGRRLSTAGIVTVDSPFANNYQVDATVTVSQAPTPTGPTPSPTLSPTPSPTSTCTQETREIICENQGHSQDQCSALSCCGYYGGSCWANDGECNGGCQAQQDAIDMAHRSMEQCVADPSMTCLFNAFDADQDGFWIESEYNSAFLVLGGFLPSWAQFFSEDLDGKLAYDEFELLTVDRNFKQIDMDGNNFLDAQELEYAGAPPDVLTTSDTNGDGKVSLSEFKAYFNSLADAQAANTQAAQAAANAQAAQQNADQAKISQGEEIAGFPPPKPITKETAERSMQFSSGALVAGPLIMMFGQDMERVLQLLNSFITAGFSTAVTRVVLAESFYPDIIIEFFRSLMAAVFIAVSTIQNGGVSEAVSGAVIGNAVSEYILTTVTPFVYTAVADCKGVSSAVSDAFPNGAPYGCDPELVKLLPYVMWVIAAAKYSIIAAAAITLRRMGHYLLLLNGASVGAQMFAGTIRSYYMVARIDKCPCFMNAMTDVGAFIYFGFLIFGFVCQATLYRLRAKPPKPWDYVPLYIRFLYFVNRLTVPLMLLNSFADKTISKKLPASVAWEQVKRENNIEGPLEIAARRAVRKALLAVFVPLEMTENVVKTASPGQCMIFMRTLCSTKVDMDQLQNWFRDVMGPTFDFNIVAQEVLKGHMPFVVFPLARKVGISVPACTTTLLRYFWMVSSPPLTGEQLQDLMVGNKDGSNILTCGIETFKDLVTNKILAYGQRKTLMKILSYATEQNGLQEKKIFLTNQITDMERDVVAEEKDGMEANPELLKALMYSPTEVSFKKRLEMMLLVSQPLFLVFTLFCVWSGIKIGGETSPMWNEFLLLWGVLIAIGLALISLSLNIIRYKTHKGRCAFVFGVSLTTCVCTLLFVMCRMTYWTEWDSLDDESQQASQSNSQSNSTNSSSDNVTNSRIEFTTDINSITESHVGSFAFALAAFLSFVGSVCIIYFVFKFLCKLWTNKKLQLEAEKKQLMKATMRLDVEIKMPEVASNNRFPISQVFWIVILAFSTYGLERASRSTPFENSHDASLFCIIWVLVCVGGFNFFFKMELQQSLIIQYWQQIIELNKGIDIMLPPDFKVKTVFDTLRMMVREIPVASFDMEALKDIAANVNLKELHLGKKAPASGELMKEDQIPQPNIFDMQIERVKAKLRTPVVLAMKGVCGFKKREAQEIYAKTPLSIIRKVVTKGPASFLAEKESIQREVPELLDALESSLLPKMRKVMAKVVVAGFRVPYSEAKKFTDLLKLEMFEPLLQGDFSSLLDVEALIAKQLASGEAPEGEPGWTSITPATASGSSSAMGNKIADEFPILITNLRIKMKEPLVAFTSSCFMQSGMDQKMVDYMVPFMNFNELAAVLRNVSTGKPIVVDLDRLKENISRANVDSFDAVVIDWDRVSETIKVLNLINANRLGLPPPREADGAEVDDDVLMTLPKIKWPISFPRLTGNCLSRLIEEAPLLIDKIPEFVQKLPQNAPKYAWRALSYVYKEVRDVAAMLARKRIAMKINAIAPAIAINQLMQIMMVISPKEVPDLMSGTIDLKSLEVRCVAAGMDVNFEEFKNGMFQVLRHSLIELLHFTTGSKKQLLRTLVGLLEDSELMDVVEGDLSQIYDLGSLMERAQAKAEQAVEAVKGFEERKQQVLKDVEKKVNEAGQRLNDAKQELIGIKNSGGTMTASMHKSAIAAAERKLTVAKLKNEEAQKETKKMLAAAEHSLSFAKRQVDQLKLKVTPNMEEKMKKLLQTRASNALARSLKIPRKTAKALIGNMGIEHFGSDPESPKQNGKSDDAIVLGFWAGLVKDPVTGLGLEVLERVALQHSIGFRGENFAKIKAEKLPSLAKAVGATPLEVQKATQQDAEENSQYYMRQLIIGKQKNSLVVGLRDTAEGRINQILCERTGIPQRVLRVILSLLSFDELKDLLNGDFRQFCNIRKLKERSRVLNIVMDWNTAESSMRACRRSLLANAMRNWLNIRRHESDLIATLLDPRDAQSMLAGGANALLGGLDIKKLKGKAGGRGFQLDWQHVEDKLSFQYLTPTMKLIREAMKNVSATFSIYWVDDIIACMTNTMKQEILDTASRGQSAVGARLLTSIQDESVMISLAEKTQDQLADSKGDAHVKDANLLADQLKSVFLYITLQPLDRALCQGTTRGLLPGTQPGTILELLPCLDVDNVVEPLFKGDMSVLLLPVSNGSSRRTPSLWDRVADSGDGILKKAEKDTDHGTTGQDTDQIKVDHHSAAQSTGTSIFPIPGSLGGDETGVPTVATLSAPFASANGGKISPLASLRRGCRDFEMRLAELAIHAVMERKEEISELASGNKPPECNPSRLSQQAREVASRLSASDLRELVSSGTLAPIANLARSSPVNWMAQRQTVKVTMVRARNVRAVNTMSKSSDPFCTVEVENSSQPPFGKTNVVSGNCNPEWKPVQYRLASYIVGQKLIFKVYDDAFLAKDVLLGTAELTAAHFQEVSRGTGKTFVIELSDAGRGENDEVATLEVIVEFDNRKPLIELKDTDIKSRPNVTDWLPIVEGSAFLNVSAYARIILSGIMRIPNAVVRQLDANTDVFEKMRLIAGDYKAMMNFEGVMRFEPPLILSKACCYDRIEGPAPESCVIMKLSAGKIPSKWPKRIAVVLMIIAFACLCWFGYRTELMCVDCAPKTFTANTVTVQSDPRAAGFGGGGGAASPAGAVGGAAAGNLPNSSISSNTSSAGGAAAGGLAAAAGGAAAGGLSAR